MRSGWGKAKFKVGLLAVDIRALSASGLNLEEIFAKLSGDGRLDTGRSTFKRYAAELLRTPETANAAPPAAPSRGVNGGGKKPGPRQSRANPFKSRDAGPDEKTLFGDGDRDGAGNNVP